jgi:ADP-ribose pyrophosphatase YjhB (NUDIX family)
MKKSKSAGGVVLSQFGNIALVNQRGLTWSLPKGHIEEGETPLEAAIREIGEETGLKKLIYIKPLLTYKRYKIGLDGLDDLSEQKTIYMFLFKVEGEPSLAPIDTDNPEAIWIPKEKVADTLTHPKDKEFFRKIMFEIS